jgi:hypothetical protein
MSEASLRSGMPEDLVPASTPTASARELRRRLKAGPRRQPGSGGERLSGIYMWAVFAVLGVVVAPGLARSVSRWLAGPGWAVPGSPGRLFAVAALLMLLGLLGRRAISTGPVAAGPALRFWLLSAPVLRRVLLRGRFLALIAGTAAAACVAAAVIAHAGSVAVAPAAAIAVPAAVTVVGGAVWGQESREIERVVLAVTQAMRAVAALGFGSLATGAGRAGANSVLHLPGTGLAVLAGLLSLAALGCGWRAYRTLDRISVSELSRGQGVWNAWQVASMSLDMSMLTDFLDDQHARTRGRIRPAAIGADFATALARTEWLRVRRRPDILIQAALAAVAWWGCRAVLPPVVLPVIAVYAGYRLVLPMAGTLRQLALGPGLRAQFAPRDRWLARASAARCLTGAVAWNLIVFPGLAVAGKAALAIVVPLGITAVAWRKATRPPLDYSVPPLPTPMGDIPVDLIRQELRGLLLLATLIVLVTLAAH